LKLKVCIRGGGDIASGIGWRLHRCGFKVLITEIENPLCVRRKVSFSEAVYEGKCVVEGVEGVLVDSMEEIEGCWREEKVPVIIDPECNIKREIAFDVLVDAIMAKRNLGTNITDAPLVIGIGPGFEAGIDTHFVIETKRGHYLGRCIEKGGAEPDTGIPGPVMGYTTERVVRAPVDGVWKASKSIGDVVKRGELVGNVQGVEVHAEIDGVIRGLIRNGIEVKNCLKIGDIDPRGIRDYCFTISDKALAVSGGVLEAILRTYLKPSFCAK